MPNDGSYETRSGITPEGTHLAPLADAQAADPTLWELLHRFTGNQYSFLIAFLRDPEQSHTHVARSVGVTPESAYNWRYSTPGFKEAMDAIRAHRPQLRQEYAKLAMEGAIPDLVDAMIQRGKGQGVASQRAGERVLETTGVLKREPEQLQQPVQVVTHTYVLVEREPNGSRAQGVVVETSDDKAMEVKSQVKELSAPKSTES